MALTRQTVEAMQSKRTAFGDLWMFECAKFAHGEPLLHGARSPISDSGERKNVLKTEHPETNSKGSLRGLCRQPFAPLLKGKAPIDFHTGRAGELRGRDVEAGESDKLARAFRLSGLETPTTFMKRWCTTVSHSVTFRAGQ